MTTTKPSQNDRPPLLVPSTALSGLRPTEIPTKSTNDGDDDNSQGNNNNSNIIIHRTSLRSAFS